MANNDVAKNVEKVFSNLDEAKKAEITDYVLQLGIRRDDPLFNLYAELGTTQTVLQKLPGRLDVIVNKWTDMVDDKLRDASSVAIQQQKTAIAEAAKELIKKTGGNGGALPQLGFGLNNWKLAQIGGVLGFVLALGTGIGIFTYKTVADSTSSQAVAQTLLLKPEDQNLLSWAKSQEGQLARKIYQKNAPIIKTCRQKKDEGCTILVN
ncbi:hypothetical protein WA1_51045 [Scytonema hofmannii PCC 7110]|uniref:Uncharacterized protein n=1 Tax=Scytonema hofmannii PCC 7110 TaxID=128403 RepID=A0A139WQ37_9CYAN|nr:DUF6753 family protein [Scytonema hofmannii]KYC34546.1 hypothetical protein WA1_51045 [Scytonema hofmannii PCC 7110]